MRQFRVLPLLLATGVGVFTLGIMLTFSPAQDVHAKGPQPHYLAEMTCEPGSQVIGTAGWKPGKVGRVEMLLTGGNTSGVLLNELADMMVARQRAATATYDLSQHGQTFWGLTLETTFFDRQDRVITTLSNSITCDFRS